MEYYWTPFKNSTSGDSSTNNGNCNSHAWESSWDLMGVTGNSRLDEYCSYPYSPSVEDSGCAFQAAALQERGDSPGERSRNPDPHLTCLKLGKRHYFEDVPGLPAAELRVASPEGSSATVKKGKPRGGVPSAPVSSDDAAPVVAPRCQVEGCESALGKAKEYHRRHRVCAMHAKAPSVGVFGIEQRFCQQCSRFHAVSEFDEAKRSCRRRLAGHNERRRKNSQEHSLAKKHSPDTNMMVTGRPHFINSSESALSLLSSSTDFNPSWHISPPSDDLPARRSAALRELIAENRASVLTRTQLINPNQMENCSSYNSIRSVSGRPVSDGHVTLDLMQDPGSEFGLLSMQDRKANGEECSQLWHVPLGY